MRIDWIRPGLLAGSARPGLLEPLEDDARQLRDFGFELLVNLTETAYELGCDGHAFEFYNFPIVDMSVPMPETMATACGFLWERLDAGTKTLVHCKAGLGRTGTLLACLLVYRGANPERAVTEVRLVNPHFIQNRTQESFVRRFSEYLSKERAPAGTGPDDPSVP